MNDNKLTILWTNADPVTSELMVFMYAGNAKARGWFEDVEIIVWGAPTKLVVENEHIRDELFKLEIQGVNVRFCIGCASELRLVDQLIEYDFELDGMGIPLTEVINTKGILLTI